VGDAGGDRVRGDGSGHATDNAPKKGPPPDGATDDFTISPVIWSTGLLIIHAGFQVLIYPAMRLSPVLQVASYIDAAFRMVVRRAPTTDRR
jgi:hypothetical protein